MNPVSAHLVIIDDEEDLLDLYKYNFMQAGFSVSVFDRARPALEYILTERPDMILCDWMMPDMDGLELCHMIKGKVDLAGIPFVMVTCHTGQEAQRKALAAGVTAYIPKPVRMSDLLGKVRGILTRKVA
ncbi:MAG: response regulator [Bacteroidetes bacterium]|nr:MAG: response regulator [Bacteroidota bacterium]